MQVRSSGWKIVYDLLKSFYVFVDEAERLTPYVLFKIKWRARSQHSILRLRALGGSGYPMWSKTWITSLGTSVTCGRMLTYVLLCSFHMDWVLEMYVLSLGSFLLYVFDLGRLWLQYFCLCVYSIIYLVIIYNCTLRLWSYTVITTHTNWTRPLVMLM